MSAKIDGANSKTMGGAILQAKSGEDSKEVFKTATLVATHYNTVQAWCERNCTWDSKAKKFVHNVTFPLNANIESCITTLMIGYPGSPKAAFTPFVNQALMRAFYITNPK